MTTASDEAAKPVPVRVVLPADPVLGQPEQEVVARLWRRRQVRRCAMWTGPWTRQSTRAPGCAPCAEPLRN
ncbi:hypothetical protein [Streptomyces europaeiscabiei]|uniref:hypothetical protein n=1 Tax=Streptomyces europaeiscabiei TaxID=146819 RepID=UPI002E2E0369|nr:hypothetical protein [Streptomyces europaeiscabiei]